jgi:hypothetical protein
MPRLSLRADVLHYLQRDLGFRLDWTPRKVRESDDNTLAYWCGVPDQKEVKYYEDGLALCDKIAKRFNVGNMRDPKPGQPFVSIIGRLYLSEEHMQVSLQLWDEKHEMECEILLRPSYFPGWFTKLLLSDYLNWDTTVEGHADIRNATKKYFLKKCPNKDLLSLGPKYYVDREQRCYCDKPYTQRVVFVQYDGVPVARITRAVDHRNKSSTLTLWISKAQRDAPEFIMPKEGVMDLDDSFKPDSIEFESTNWYKIFWKYI